MTSDQQVVAGNLDKSICQVCGAVADTETLTGAQARLLYGNGYHSDEHYFFTASGPVARSEIFARWILANLPGPFNSLLEIGCGQGNVLQRLQTRLSKMKPRIELRGIDGNEQSCELARAKGLDVQQGMVLGQGDKLPNSDILLAITVAEHVDDIRGFLSVLASSVSSGGRILLCLPVQDYPGYNGYDLFIAEHVWHLTRSQLCYILHNAGLEVIGIDTNPFIAGVNLFICRASSRDAIPLMLCEPIPAVRNRMCWDGVFWKVDRWLNNKTRIAVFGGGEVLALLLAYTSLGDRHGDRQVLACLDEDVAKVGSKRNGIDVQPVEWLNDNPVDGVLLTLNQRYHPQVLEELEPYGVQVFSWA